MDEIGLIKHLTHNLKVPKNLVVPIGDDCAYIQKGDAIELYTTDTMVEGVHFDLSFFPPEVLAYKLVAVNLSDIASCGGVPRYALISLTVPKHVDRHFLEKFYKEIAILSSVYNFSVIGGDVTSGKEFNLTMTLIGEASKVNALRSNARAGDILFCVGDLGWAGLGLLLIQGETLVDNKKYGDKAVDALIHPVPMLKEGKWLSDRIERLAMIDSSDGLGNCAYWLAKESGVTIVIDAELAIDRHLTAVTDKARELTYSAGDDYMLVGTMSEADWEAIRPVYPHDFAPIRKIGKVTPQDKVLVYEKSLVEGHIKLSSINTKGYSHF